MLAYIDAAIGGKTLWGGGAPELGDLRLVEDGGEREGTLVSDRVPAHIQVHAHIKADYGVRSLTL